MNKTTVAIIRGWYLSQWEMKRYEPLNREFAVTAMGTHKPLYDLSHIDLPVRKFHWPGELLYGMGTTVAQLANRGLYKYLRWNQWMFGLEKALRGFDIIHAADTFHLFSLQAVRAKKRYGGKVVLTVWENIPFQDEKRFVYRPITREVIRHTDLFLPVTRTSKDMLLLEGVPAEKIVVIPHPVDLSQFSPQPINTALRASFGFQDKDLVILFIGRLHKSKGLNFLLSAIGKLRREGAAALAPKLLVIGIGEREREYKRLAVELDIERQVVWCGGVAHQDLPDYYAAADVFVLPSIPVDDWQEQFGMVLTEAMACGKPVLSTLSGSIPDVVADAGILVPPADDDALFHALKKLGTSPELRTRYAAKARDRAERVFGTERIAEATAQVYRDLAGNKTRRTGTE